MTDKHLSNARYWYHRAHGLYSTAGNHWEEEAYEDACHAGTTAIVFLFKAVLEVEEHERRRLFELPDLYSAACELHPVFIEVPHIQAIAGFYQDATKMEDVDIQVGLFEEADALRVMETYRKAREIVDSLYETSSW